MKRTRYELQHDDALPPAQRRRLAEDEVKPMFNRLRQRGAAERPRAAGASLPKDDAHVMTDDIVQSMHRGGVIHSTGRGQPITEQSLVVETVVLKANQFETRARNLEADMVAPLGPREAFGCATGELAFGVKRETQANQAPRVGFQGFGETEVTTTSNGLHKDAQLFCAGVLSGDKDAKSVLMDPAIQNTAAGLKTIVNTGPKTIPAHGGVGWLATPYTVMGDDGVQRPAIQQLGIPQGKFRPMTVPFDDLMTPAIVDRCVDVVQSLQEEDAPRTVDEFKDMWRRARARVRHVVLDYPLGANTQMSNDDFYPLDIYLGWLMLTLLDVGDREGVFNLLEKVQIEQANLNGGESPFLNKAQAVRYDAGTYRAHMERRKGQCLVNHASWVKRHYVGKTLKTAAPGQAMDILLGYC